MRKLSQYIDSDSKQNQFIFLDKLNKCSKTKTCKKNILESEVNSFKQIININHKKLTKQDELNFTLLLIRLLAL